MRSGRDRALNDGLHITTLWSFAVAQPLFSVLAGNPTFLVAKKLSAADLVIFTLAVCFLVPSLLVAFEVLAGLLGRKTRVILHAGFVGLLLAAIALPILKRYSFGSEQLLVAQATGFSALSLLVYLRSATFRTFLTALSPAPLLFVAVFLLHSPVKGLLTTRQHDPRPASAGIAPTPIVFVVFDELPVTHLMDESGEIDAHMYPNFARLARASHWFRNATATADHTHVALPSILSGKYPNGATLPTLRDHPDNLFTLLAPAYDLRVREAITELSPSRAGDSRPWLARMRSLFLDSVIVYLHVITPGAWTRGLPDITHGWGDFGHSPKPAKAGESGAAGPFGAGIHKLVALAMERMAEDRAALFRQFVAEIEEGEGARLHFLHVLLPHLPWTYLPSGHTYPPGGSVPGLSGERWGAEEWPVWQGLQRHLLQLRFVDSLVGELLDRLEGTGVYDRSLLIVTSDHGVSFKPGGSRRYIDDGNFDEIMPVPLFIKVPGQREGTVDDRNVMSVDILPTIAAVLNTRIPWTVDGSSVLDGSAPDRAEKVIFATQTAERRMTFASGAIDRAGAVKRWRRLFGQNADGLDVFALGRTSEIVGRAVADLPSASAGGFESWIDQTPVLSIDEGGMVPAFLTGRVRGGGRAKTVADQVAISVNGTIAAVVPLGRFEDGDASFSAMVPEHHYRLGENKVDVLVVSEPEGEPLRLLATKPSRWTLSTADGSTSISLGGGQTVSVRDGRLVGYVDAVVVRKEEATFSGWAVDSQKKEAASQVVAFHGGTRIGSARPSERRPDIVKLFGSAACAGSGFRFSVLLPAARATALPVRLFAVSKDGTATELRYTCEYPWINLVAPAACPSAPPPTGEGAQGATAVGRGAETIVTPSGRLASVRERLLVGYVDSVVLARDGQATFSGWAVDTRRREGAKRVVVLEDGALIGSAVPNRGRPDIATLYKSASAEQSGFSVSVRLRAARGGAAAVRLFALSEEDGLATELRYTCDYPWIEKVRSTEPCHPVAGS